MNKEKIIWEEIWPQLLGFYPFMGEDGGNYTAVLISEDSELIDKRKTGTVLNHLARTFALDLRLVKAKGRQVLRSRREVPLVLLPELVLLPVRKRKAPMKDAGSLGYVILAHVADWDEAPEKPWRTRIFFHDETSLDVLTTVKTFQNKIAEAELVLGEYNRRHQPLSFRPGYPASYGWPGKKPLGVLRETSHRRGYMGQY